MVDPGFEGVTAPPPSAQDLLVARPDVRVRLGAFPIGAVPVARPLPGVPAHVVEAQPVRWVAANRSGAPRVSPSLEIREVARSGVEGDLRRSGDVLPVAETDLAPALSRRELPLRFRGQPEAPHPGHIRRGRAVFVQQDAAVRVVCRWQPLPLAEPVAVADGIVPGEGHRGVIRPLVEAGSPPAHLRVVAHPTTRVGIPGAGAAQAQDLGLECGQLLGGEPSGHRPLHDIPVGLFVHRSLRRRPVAGVFDERAELGDGHLVA